MAIIASHEPYWKKMEYDARSCGRPASFVRDEDGMVFCSKCARKRENMRKMVVTAADCVDWIKKKHEGEDLGGCWKFFSKRKATEHHKVWMFRHNNLGLMETVHEWDGVISDKVPPGEKL